MKNSNPADGGGKQDRLSEIVSPLLQWYDNHARILPWRENPIPYAVWISEIMLQQTRVEAVKPYFDRWMKSFPDLLSLANASEDEVMKLWEGLGYYSRARNLHKAARLVAEKFDGSLPPSFDELRSLPGIGEYTAGAIGSIAFGLPVPCVDGNVLRVVARLTAEHADIGTATAKKLLTGWVRDIVPKDRPGDFNQAMMELGATVCLPNGTPKCGLCPLAFLCEAHLQDRATDFPVKGEKPSRKIEKKTILILLSQEIPAPGSSPEAAPATRYRIALRKRPKSGLLAGLWEFPNFDGELTEAEVRRILDLSGIKLSSLVKLKQSKHIFTHIEWEMSGYLAVAEESGSNEFQIAEQSSDYHTESGKASDAEGLGFQWIGADTLEEKLVLPAAFKTYHQIMKHYISKES